MYIYIYVYVYIFIYMYIYIFTYVQPIAFGVSFLHSQISIDDLVL